MAIQNLKILIQKMQPTLSKEKYYFATIDESLLPNILGYASYLLGIFREEEGITLVFSEEIKEEVGELTEEKISGPFALITLKVNSDLLAVGLLAKVTEALAKEGIAVNAFSAYFHDHLFVPYGKKKEAMGALGKLQASC